jgi:tetratricopeptide (TPR) repeat protein
MRVFVLASGVMLAACGCAWASGYQDFSLGISAGNRGDNEGAIQALTRALGDPDLPQHLRATAFVARGDAYAAKKQNDAAIADYTAAINLRPDYPEAIAERAVVNSAAHRYPEAVADRSRLIKDNPYDLEAYLDRALLYYAMHQYADEISDCNAILSLWPKISVNVKMTPQGSIYWFRGNAYFLLGQYDQAIADFTTAAELNEKLSVAYADRGVAEMMKGALDEAHSDLDEAVDRSDDNSTTRGSVIGGVDFNVQADASAAGWELGIDEWAMGRFDNAARSFEHALKRSPKNSLAALGLAITFAKSGASENLSGDAASVDLAIWPGPILALWLGKSTADQLRAAADRGGSDGVAQRHCQVNFYLGEWQLAHSDAASAHAALGVAASECPPGVIEKEAAQVELGRMQVAARK